MQSSTSLATKAGRFRQIGAVEIIADGHQVTIARHYTLTTGFPVRPNVMLGFVCRKGYRFSASTDPPFPSPYSAA
jgi:hypothetical protein